VAVKNVDGLQIIPPEEFLGDVTLQILLFKGKNDPPQARTVTVSIQPKGQATAAVTSAVDETIPSVGPQAQTERPSLVPKEEEDAAMDRASDLLEKADIAAARLIYESLTHKGSGRAAFAMGQTYDPVFLGRFVVEGLKPDIEQATKWYLRAAELGSSEARARLVALNVER
jgi:TPR repeat protein